MIKRVYFKDNLSFSECKLEFAPGLNVITGASGAGKSVIFKSILSAFALAENTANLLSVEASERLEDESLQHEDINIYSLKKEKSTRHFYNHQSVSKKLLADKMSQQITYLAARNYDELSPSNLLKALDKISQRQNSDILAAKQNFAKAYAELEGLKTALAELEKDESELEQAREFLEYEINKIQAAAPKIGEYDELMKLKTRLSKSDKLKQALNEAGPIFNYSPKVEKLLKLAEIDAGFFIDAMSELEDKFYELSAQEDEADIEKVLNRLEQLHAIIKKYGSEDNALVALEQKKKRLEELSDVEFNKFELAKKIERQNALALNYAAQISEHRKSAICLLQGRINDYLNLLYLKNLRLNHCKIALNPTGYDEIKIELEGAAFKDISSGELNRLRLAYLAALSSLDAASGVMFLDEIDANLSGKEAISIAKVISDLAKNYQIFVITHLPWLCAQANRHILVEKTAAKSSARVLKATEIENELARMISDEKTSESALEFARALLKNKPRKEDESFNS